MNPLPSWADELATLLPACGHFLVTGNTRDLFLVEAGAVEEPGLPPREPILKSFPDIVRAVLAQRQVDTLIGYEVTTGAHPIPATPEAAARVDTALGRPLAQVGAGESLVDLANLLALVSEARQPVGLLVRSASRLILESQRPTEREFEFYRRADRIARTAVPGPHGLFNPVLWELDSELDVPAWFVMGNEKLRSIGVPLPDAGTRLMAAERFIRRMPPAAQEAPPGAPEPHRALAEQTAGLPLVAMESIVGVARDQGLPPHQLEEAARAYRVGIIDNPWRHPYLTDRLRRELAQFEAVEAAPPDASPPLAKKDVGLVHQVLGQRPAIRKALDVLVRSVVGMTGAQARAGSRPRGVLFLAGPTGVGKTELAKGLTRLVFDDESLYIRFDMSEFSAEHAADRLIGAPPGYLGFERGGELTNAVRQQPFSLVLFDEIEKAHPSILDKFLQLLDDGRLTDGRGETAYFTEAIVVFTSNLGIYRPKVVTDDEGNRRVESEANVTPADGPAEVVTKVKAGIRHHFTVNLGRPELLNRIGDDNIVVFDFIRPDVGEQIVDKMVANVLARVRDEHQLDLRLGHLAREALLDACLSDECLAMGGRGIGAKVETVLVNPVAHEVFRQRATVGNTAEVLDLTSPGGTPKATLKSLDPGVAPDPRV